MRFPFPTVATSGRGRDWGLCVCGASGEHSPLFHPHLLPFQKISGYPKLLVTLVTANLSHLSPETPRSLRQSSGNYGKPIFIKEHITITAQPRSFQKTSFQASLTCGWVPSCPPETSWLCQPARALLESASSQRSGFQQF